ncbi:MAG: peptidylprolyl isomerase [Luteimonas sp.]
MLQQLRDKTSGWIAGTVLGLLTIPFAFFGMEQYMQQTSANWTARIEAPPTWWKAAPHWWPARMLWQSDEISADDFRSEFEQARQQERSARGDQFDAREFEGKDNKRRVLDQLIDARVLALMSENAGVVVSDAQVRAAIEAVPAFQVDGKFNAQQYQLMLASQVPQRTPRQFEQLVREDLQKSMMPSALAQSGFATTTEVEQVMRLLGEKRDVSYVQMPAPAPDLGAVSAAEIQRWYDAHPSDYRAPESVVVEYVDIDGSQLQPPAATDSALKQRYAQEQARFVEPEERLASHILVRVDKGANAQAEAAAKARADQIAAQARAPGADFSALATADSDDDGSKAAGGDLGWISKGMMAKPFEDALFAMKKGEIIGPVRSDFGWHVIQMRDLKQGQQTPFEQVRDQLAKEQADTDRERLFNDLTGKLVDQVYRNPTSLAPAARAANLTVQRSGTLVRGQGLGGIFANPLVQRAAFSDTLVQDGTVSDPIEIGPNHSVLIRVVDHQPERVMPLTQVGTQVIAAIRRDRAAKAVVAAADAMLAEVRAGKSFAAAAAARQLEPSQVADLPRGVALPDAKANKAIFAAAAPKPGKSTLGKVVLDDGSVVVYALHKTIPGDTKEATPAQRTTLKQQLAEIGGNDDVNALVKALRKQMRITVAEDRL